MLADSPGREDSDIHLASFPTASKERRKKKEEEAKQEGREIPVKKKTRTYDRQFDDCGDSLAGLGEHVDRELVGFELRAGERDSMHSSEFAMDAFSHPRWFIGSEAAAIGRDLSGVKCFNDIYNLEAYQADLQVQPVACEIAGGSARTSRI